MCNIKPLNVSKAVANALVKTVKWQQVFKPMKKDGLEAMHDCFSCTVMVKFKERGPCDMFYSYIFYRYPAKLLCKYVIYQDSGH